MLLEKSVRPTETTMVWNENIHLLSQQSLVVGGGQSTNWWYGLHSLWVVLLLLETEGRLIAVWMWKGGGRN